MAHDLDPQVASSLITGGSGIISSLITAGSGIAVGVVSTLFGLRRRTSGRTAQDQRCERVCASMVSMGETMLAVMKALGVDDPRLTPHIAQMETRIAEAKAYLDTERT